ncbi:MAG: hypothetical protein CMJ59_22830 [Planctomycetaceae bacterium]|nr:hypothetical protein [Planctomycetaceae bacterium]
MMPRLLSDSVVTLIVGVALSATTGTVAIAQQSAFHAHSEHLQILQPLLGQWEFEGAAANEGALPAGAEFKGTLSLRWILNRSAMELKFRTTADDRVIAQGLLHYSWDPVKKTVVLDGRTRGGDVIHGEWVSADEKTFIFKLRGRQADGTSKSSTRTITLAADNQSQEIVWTDQMIGGEQAPDTKVTARRVPRPLRDDRAAVIGTWTTTFTNDEGKPIRAVKEVTRNRETVHYYAADDTILRTHTNRYWLQRRGDYNTWTFPGMKIVAGKEAGKQIRFPQAAWYIYRVAEDTLTEFQGLGEDDGKPQLVTWTRVNE